MKMLILFILLGFSFQLDASPKFYRYVGINENIGDGAPDGFSFTIAFEPIDSYGMVLENTLFPSGQNFYVDTNAGLETATFYDDFGNSLSAQNAMAFYDWIDQNGDDKRSIYDLTISPYDLAFNSAPLVAFSAKAKPAASMQTAGLIFALKSQLNKIKKFKRAKPKN